MKYILFLFFLLGFIACRKEEDPYIGKLQAKLNNGFGLINMELVAESSGADSLAIHSSVLSTEGGWALGLSKVPKKVGRFILNNSLHSVNVTEWISDCMVGRRYYLPEIKSTNYIEITAYDPATGDIEGRFEFTAYSAEVEGRAIAFDLQDSMSFTNGEFFTRIRP